MQDGAEASSESLMARYQTRLDAAAFEELVSRFLAPALGVARQLLADRALAEDAVQETFLRLVRRRERYLPSRPFSSWFYTILRNVCTDLRRRRANQARLAREAARRNGSAAPEPSLDGLDARELLGLLPEDSRQVLTLRIVHGLSFREVGAALGISEEAAKKRGQRALRRLRKLRAVQQLRADLWLPAHALGPAGRGVPAGVSEEDVPGPAS